MARAAAKKKRDVPPLYMLVADGGRLDPAFQHDQERLMSFRKGTRLVVTAEPDGSRRGVRKWHAIIGKAVKNSLLPWVTVSAADEAIRLALDLYEPKKANDGSWHRVTQSLNDLTDEELDEQIELMSAMIYRISGVDPDEFRKELAGAGDERFKSDYDRPAADNDAGAATSLPDDDSQAQSGEALADPTPLGEQSSAASIPDPESAGGAATNSEGELDAGNDAGAPDDSGSVGEDSTSDTAATNSAQGTTPETGADADSGGADALATTDGTVAPTGEDLTGLSASPAAELSEEDRAWLKLGALWMLAALPAHEPEALRVLIVQINEIRKVMPKDVSRATLQRMESMRLHCRQVCDGKEKLDKRFMAETAMAMPAEIEPKPFKTTRAAT